MPEPDSPDSFSEQSPPPVHSDVHASDVLARFVAAVEHAPFVAIQSFDRDGVVLLWNTNTANLYGIPASDALGKRMSDLLFESGQQKEFIDAIERIWSSTQSELPRDWRIKTPTGKEVWVYSTMFPEVREGKVHQIFCVDVDITIRKREEQALLGFGANLCHLYERSIDAIMLIDERRFVDANPASMKLFGYTNKSDIVGRYPEDISPPMQSDGRTSKDKAQDMLALARRNGNHRFEWQHLRGNREIFWAEVLLTEIPANDKQLLYVVVRDVSARKADEQSLRLAAQVFENSREGILVADKSQRIILVNRAFSEITGYAADEVVGNSPHDLFHTMRDPVFYQSVLDALNQHDHWQGELWGRNRNGEDYPLFLSITTVRDSHHQIINYISNLTDISERKEADEKIQHMAEHDPLTGLPNRTLLRDRLRQAIAAAQRHGTKLAILFLDLDRFKNINDSFGHHIGDKLLQIVAARLQKSVRIIDTTSRLGGDEFVIMLADVGNGDPIAHIAENILSAINVPYSIDGCEFNITTSIGISTYPDDSADSDTLIKNADVAMYHAKSIRGNRYQFFDQDMNTRIVERTLLENSLRNALKKNEFILYYQPQMNMIGDQTIGAEALIRWQHPALGLIFPDQFIRVAEDCGLIIPIGDWVLRTACQQAKAWHVHGSRIVVAVNLSVAQFQQKNLLQSVTAALLAADLEPKYLELEITESILMDEKKPAIETLQALREMGVKVAIDDFGTGYSSLSYLKHIPIDKLKIDKSFVHDINVDIEDAAIINAIIVMAKGLHLKVIAEGVETLEQFRFLESHGCDEYQGNYSSGALQPHAFLEFLASIG